MIPYVRYMPDTYQRAREKLRHFLYGVSSGAARWETCVAGTEQAMEFALGGLYVDEYFSEKRKTEVCVSQSYTVMLKR